MADPATWTARASGPSLVARCRTSIVEPVLSVLFPPRCVGCGDFETHLCDTCRSLLVRADDRSCPRCGEPGPRPLVSGRCSACMERDLKFEGAASAFVHQGVARSLVSNFKLGGQPVLGRVMAGLALPAFHRFLSSIPVEPPVLVTWVPSHPSRTRERGYNQAEILARLLAAASSSVDCRQLVEKVRLTKHQRGLDRDDRLANLAGSFAPCAKAAGRAQSPGPGTTHTAVIVVDDVSTTGATGCAIAEVVAECAGLPVYLFSFSKVVTGVGERHD